MSLQAGEVSEESRCFYHDIFVRTEQEPGQSLHHQSNLALGMFPDDHGNWCSLDFLVGEILCRRSNNISRECGCF